MGKLVRSCAACWTSDARIPCNVVSLARAPDLYNNLYQSSSARCRLPVAVYEPEVERIAMHFALPPRKPSHPLPYARKPTPTANAQRRRRQLQILGYVTLGALTLLLVLKYIWSSGLNGVEDGPSEIEGRQDIVIVTVFNNDTMGDEYVRMIRSNRDHYAARHGRHRSL